MKSARSPKIIVSSSQKAMRVPRKRIARLARFVAEREQVRLAEVDVAVVGEREIAGLSRRFLGRGHPTDVISFDLSEGPPGGITAQIAVCGELAVREAPLRGLTPARELMLYVVHGLLHLMGYDDTTVRGAARMHAREDELLAEFFRKA